MSNILTRRAALMTGFAALTLTAMPTHLLAQTVHEVQMLNADPDDKKKKMVYSPRIIVVEPGDSVKFVVADRGHNSATVKGMMPDGAEGWKGKISKDVEVTFNKPGFYGYQCTPHATVGMVGLVIVKGEGMMDNFEDAKGVKQRGKAKKAWKEIWEEVDAMEDLTTS